MATHISIADCFTNCKPFWQKNSTFSVQNAPIGGNRHDLPWNELAGRLQRTLGGVFQPAAAGYLHPHNGNLSDVIVADDIEAYKLWDELVCGSQKGNYEEKRKIIYKLTNEKGVDKNIVENIVFDEIDDDFELELAEKMARKFVKTKKIEDKSDSQKVGVHLFQKGFDWRIINKVMATLFDIYED